MAPRGRPRKNPELEEAIDTEFELEEEEEEAEEEDTDEVSAQIAALADELKSVAKDKVARKSTVKKIKEYLSQLRIEDYEELAESPTIQALVRMFGDKLAPGETRYKGTLAEISRPLTHADYARFPQVTFVPAETIPITINDVTYQLVEDEEITIPSPHYGVYMEHRNALRQASINTQWLLGRSDRAPHPNWISDTSARVRAFSQLGSGKGHHGYGAILVDDIDAINEDESGSNGAEES